MKVYYVVLLFTMLLSSCNSNEKKHIPVKEGANKQALIDDLVEKKYVKNGVDKSYLSALKLHLELSDDQLERIKEAQMHHQKAIKGVKKKSVRSKLLNEMNSKIRQTLGDDHQFKQYKRFNQVWNNPISLLHLRNKLKLSKRQINQIKELKKQSAKQVWLTKKENGQNLKAKLREIETGQEQAIMKILSEKQKQRYLKIKSDMPANLAKKAVAFQ